MADTKQEKPRGKRKLLPGPIVRGINQPDESLDAVVARLEAALLLGEDDERPNKDLDAVVARLEAALQVRSAENQSVDFASEILMGSSDIIGDSPIAAVEPVHTERFMRVWEKAIDVWKGSEAAQRFMQRPHPLLSGRIPLSVVIESDEGGKKVEGILGRLKHGSAA